MSSQSSTSASIYWCKKVPVAKLDSWLEQLVDLPSDRLISMQEPNAKTAAIHYYAKNPSEIKKLIARFGGQTKSVSKKAWLATQKREFCLPIPPHFCVVADENSIPMKDRKLPSIVIPAGMAFGTGEHATTAMCLRQIALLHSKYAHGTMLDVGTGSGVLALAGALLGLKVQAIDLDPDCIRESKANALRNPHVPRVTWKLQPVEKFSNQQKFDLIVGNLYSECIIGALPRLKRHLKKGGAMVLSGILKTQSADVIKKIRSLSLTPQAIKTRGKWVCMVVASKVV